MVLHHENLHCKDCHCHLPLLLLQLMMMICLFQVSWFQHSDANSHNLLFLRYPKGGPGRCRTSLTATQHPPLGHLRNPGVWGAQYPELCENSQGRYLLTCAPRPYTFCVRNHCTRTFSEPLCSLFCTYSSQFMYMYPNPLQVTMPYYCHYASAMVAISTWGQARPAPCLYLLAFSVHTSFLLHYNVSHWYVTHNVVTYIRVHLTGNLQCVIRTLACKLAVVS